MDGPRDYHTQWNKSEKDKHHDISYSRNLKYDTNEPIYGKETDSQTQRTDLWLPNRRGVGEGWTESLGQVDSNYYIHVWM